ncbi:UrcA family protein [Sphingomonas fennica]|uniref:UrcA family protein n=2 Tax=Edaphosphingomonas fennica TaxID=114404 RepID=A0A2T4HJC0_9SPHN|nr:UrcA family protein [Sphingomonas fennica]
MTARIVSAWRLALMATALAASGSAGFAKAQDAGNEITVEAPRSVPIPVERNPYTGAAIATTTVRMSVLYGDLDLTTQRDSDRLMLRIRNVARDACKQLDRLYPLNPDESCVDKTVETSAPLGQAVIAAARGH